MKQLTYRIILNPEPEGGYQLNSGAAYSIPIIKDPSGISFNRRFMMGCADRKA